jgi:histidinol dehydrogenase
MKIIKVSQPASEAAAHLRKSTTIPDSVMENAKSIMKSVKEYGDRAIFDYTLKFDGVRLEYLKVSEQEINRAFQQVSKEQVKAIKIMRDRLAKSETAILRRLKGIVISSKGSKLERIIKPVASVGCYIPGGRARYPSTAVMCAVPAKIAGVKRIVAISPPMKEGIIDPLTLVAAKVCGVDEFYKTGGAQGIAALAYGTESIKKVSKIVGPGGIYVTAAKLSASSDVSVDMVAGPSELLILADKTADPRLVAMDLISQAEHSNDTICGLVTSSDELASQVHAEIESKIQSITRSEIVKSSLQINGFIAICENKNDCIEFANEFAPEHLEIMCKDDNAISKKIVSAGLVLIGQYSPSSATDYCIGSNHVLPTLGFGKSRASLSILDFIKIVNKVKVTKEGLKQVEKATYEMASAEGLLNHYEAIKARINEEN